MIVEFAEITFCIGIKSFFEKTGYNGTLNFERTRRNIHKFIETAVEIVFVGSKVSDSGHIKRNNAD